MSRCSRRWRLALAALPALCLAGTVSAAPVWLPGVAGGGVNVSVQSIKARRFSRTVHQQFDYSCGSAAVATLLTYQYHAPVSEQKVFAQMWKHGDKAKIQRQGFSLLDIKHYLAAHGYKANGYDAPLDKLAQVGIPAIVLISEHGYNHFVVVKGLGDGRVLIGDPSLGSRTMPLARFKKLMRSPILFVITNHRSQAVFNGRADWAHQPLAPLGAALTPSILTLSGVLSPGSITF